MTTKYKKRTAGKSVEPKNSKPSRQDMIKIGEILAQRPSLKSSERNSNFSVMSLKNPSTRQALVIGIITGLITGSLLVLVLQIASS